MTKISAEEEKKIELALSLIKNPCVEKIWKDTLKTVDDIEYFLIKCQELCLGYENLDALIMDGETLVAKVPVKNCGDGGDMTAGLSEFRNTLKAALDKSKNGIEVQLV